MNQNTPLLDPGGEPAFGAPPEDPGGPLVFAVRNGSSG
jgi:hypothetical protein